MKAGRAGEVLQEKFIAEDHVQRLVGAREVKGGHPVLADLLLLHSQVFLSQRLPASLHPHRIPLLPAGCRTPSLRSHTSAQFIAHAGLRQYGCVTLEAKHCGHTHTQAPRLVATPR